MSPTSLKIIFCCCWIILGQSAAVADEPFILLQSTTSTQNSGLFEHLLPRYRDVAGVEVRAVAVGTGQALKNARNGDGDILLVHAKRAEEKFVADGFGVERFDLMYNDFVVVGPRSDPAAVRGSGDVINAMRKIAAADATFASRGDDSGTHKKELALWSEAGVEVTGASGTWYRETGGGMGATLNVAVGMHAYVMTDRATWISFANKRGLEILVQGDPRLFNQYGVILVNPEHHPHVKAALAQSFIDWLLGETGQQAIAAFKVDGKQLFYPNAKRSVGG
jgi:tungstate transport system substrate-binding protein